MELKQVIGNRRSMRFLRPYPAARMAAHAVSARVNKPENDDATLIEAVPTLI